ncbi:hypothetical protein [Mesorhizobium opportunistum]|uniref:Major facilitator superfamily transporter n=1 Tax=Mesorhizobium opportunistum (strain LMG 24607 / HAMBI 3007 / WSM2075) TaxID=536019 RepID=F7XZR7_MESOW|nr:hypothetical protein [Mesorhizobium opportunistum]AEH88131.1 major facilitator superfamily transporter [Mesorhizobium opportunistum WSM2075]
MSNFAILAVGAALGVLLAWLGLRKAPPSSPNFSKHTKWNGVPLSVGERQMREVLLRNLSLADYPHLGVVLYGLLGAFLALYFFGSGEWVH